MPSKPSKPVPSNGMFALPAHIFPNTNKGAGDAIRWGLEQYGGKVADLAICLNVNSTHIYNTRKSGKVSPTLKHALENFGWLKPRNGGKVKKCFWLTPEEREKVNAIIERSGVSARTWLLHLADVWEFNEILWNGNGNSGEPLGLLELFADVDDPKEAQEGFRRGLMEASQGKGKPVSELRNDIETGDDDGN